MQYQGLTVIERLVLESISRGNKDISHLLLDTQLPLSLLHGLIQTLIVKGAINQLEGLLSINLNLSSQSDEEMNSMPAKKNEVRDLMEGMIKTSKELKMKKFYLTPKDEVIFKGLLNGLEDFIKKLPPPPKHIYSADYTVMFWGLDHYGRIIKKIIT